MRFINDLSFGVIKIGKCKKGMASSQAADLS